uniref:Uncharacterized protein n=1 Tax=Paramormyrops kingsleyae TaxID=1676925 RepID=A0A3B3RE84_9TELE
GNGASLVDPGPVHCVRLIVRRSPLQSSGPLSQPFRELSSPSCPGVNGRPPGMLYIKSAHTFTSNIVHPTSAGMAKQ